MKKTVPAKPSTTGHTGPAGKSFPVASLAHSGSSVSFFPFAQIPATVSLELEADEKSLAAARRNLEARKS